MVHLDIALYFKFLVFFICFKNACFMYVELNDYSTHPCKRDCTLSNTTMTCSYNFTVEWYSTLSKACYNCTTNVSDCYRPNCISGDGVVRPIIVVNRLLPGPSIEVCQNDIISVTVYNNMHLAEGVSIHWHGMQQLGSQWADGVGMVTQCPIPPHTSFQYQFTAHHQGTSFWHAHSGLQRSDGVFGPLIVRQSNSTNLLLGKYDFDLSSHVITVNDWLNEPLISRFVSHHDNGGPNKPTSLLINGRGVLHTNPVNTPLAQFNVQQNYTYRFRLINAGNLYCPIEFSIDNHNLTVIASDGNDVKPYVVQTINIFAGERYDFTLTASQSIGNYWIKAKGFADCLVNSCYQTAILSYQGASDISSLVPTFNYSTIVNTGLILNPWNTIVTVNNSNQYTQVDSLVSLENVTNIYNNTVNRKIYLAMDFHKIDNPEFNFPAYYSLAMTPTKVFYTPQINNISMMMPPFMALYQWDQIPKSLLCDETNVQNVCPENINTTYCSCLYSYQLNVNDLVELIIVDQAYTFNSNHPMHLHGHSFAVLGIEKINSSVSLDYIKQLDSQGLLKRNLVNPPVKDTVTVPGGGYTILRFVANNPGVWLFHCHLEFHSEVGMMVIFRVGQSNDLATIPKGFPQCGTFGYSGLKTFSSSSNNAVTNTLISFKILFISLVISKLGHF